MHMGKQMRFVCGPRAYTRSRVRMDATTAVSRRSGCSAVASTSIGTRTPTRCPFGCIG